MTGDWAAVLGSPVHHSLSPVLHRAAYAAHGLDWGYHAVDCDAAHLPDFLRGRGWRALSLTMPLKLAVLPLLDELDPLAATVGAVNTVVADQGRLIGHNTDVAGVTASLAAADRPVPAAPVVLGAGGAAQAVVVALARAGCGQVRLVVRDPGRAATTRALAERCGLAVEVVGWPAGRRALSQTDLIIVATPPGVADALMPQPWPTETALFDLSYHPWPTGPVEAARDAGAPHVGGLPMLVEQAAVAFELYSGLTPPRHAMTMAGADALARRARRERRAGGGSAGR